MELRVSASRQDPDDEVYDLKCRHVFHPRCLSTWLARGGNCCPICRGEVYDDDEAFRQSDCMGICMGSCVCRCVESIQRS